jgi:hypothetical protein
MVSPVIDGEGALWKQSFAFAAGESVSLRAGRAVLAYVQIGQPDIGICNRDQSTISPVQGMIVLFPPLRPGV